MTPEHELQKKAERCAQQVLGLTRDDLLLHMRFFAPALGRLRFTSRPGYGFFATDGEQYFYDPYLVLKLYRDDERMLKRTLLHSLLHLLFAHPFSYENMDEELWDIAADAAVEAVIARLSLPGISLPGDEEQKKRFKGLMQVAGALTAERIYRYFKNAGLPEASRRAYRESFCRDDHRYWKKRDKLDLSQADWERLARQIRTELKAFSKDQSLLEALEDGLSEATRQRYDYAAILSRFMQNGEHAMLSPDAFDYVYYTYGLTLYGNMPLIEPLEYREDKRIKELVIAIDTSASVSGDTVKHFVRHTLGLLRSRGSYFTDVNIHIIQCDSMIRSDAVLHNEDELDLLFSELKLSGFGATDFRPVFTYVDELLLAKKLHEIKGLIYFTDGYGIYPQKKPPYEVLFVFMNEDDYRPEVPLWAMKAVLLEDEL